MNSYTAIVLLFLGLWLNLKLMKNVEHYHDVQRQRIQNFAHEWNDSKS